MDYEKIIKVYIKIRDAKAALTKKYEAEIEELEVKQSKLSDVLLAFCKESNLDSVKGESGTAFRSIKTRYWISDWGEMEKFILEHKAFELMEKRLAQNAIKSWVRDFPDDLPPTLNSDSKYTITVRRS